MINIYDIVLNLNNEYIDFFEWEDNDNIKYIKKIPLIKVSSKFINDILNNKIKIEDDILFKLKDKVEFYDEDILEYKYLFLLADKERVIGYSYSTNEVSTLLLDEEKEVLRFASKMKEIFINYKIISSNNRNRFMTRKELFIKEKLYDEFLYLYNNKYIDKLNYYYFEYYNKIDNNFDNVFNSLISSLDNINSKHFYLFKLSNMFNKNK